MPAALAALDTLDVNMSNSRLIIGLKSLLVICLISTSASFAQEETSPAASDNNLLFKEIYLSEEGVSAIDTFGYEWYYDFQTDQFMQGNLADADNGNEFRREDADLPVEERCTERLRVNPFESKPITVDYDEYVDGDVVTLDRVIVKGWIQGDVKSLRERVIIKSTGQVDGSVEAPRITVEDGGEVLGEIIETTSIDFDDFAAFSPDGLIATTSIALFLALMAFLTSALMPTKLQNVVDCIGGKTLRSYFLGLLFIFLMPFVVVVVAITIVGIFVLPFIPLAYLFAIILGAVAIGNIVGGYVMEAITGKRSKLLFQSTIGVIIFMIPWIIASSLLGSSSAVSEGVGVFFLVISIIISTIPVCTGVGASLLTRFGFRNYQSWKDLKTRPFEAPAPPPLSGEFDAMPSAPSPPSSSDSGIDISITIRDDEDRNDRDS